MIPMLLGEAWLAAGRWRPLISAAGGVLGVVTGLLMVASGSQAFVLGPFTPVQQIRARYLGVEGTITSWDCRFESYLSTGRRGSSDLAEVLRCEGSFRGRDGFVIEGLRIYQPQAEDVDRPVTAWAVGPDATWAFTSVEWDLGVVVMIALPVFLAVAGFAFYQGAKRLCGCSCSSGW